MNGFFRNIHVQLMPAPDAYELIDCMEEIKAINEDIGPNHGYSVMAQVFRHKDYDDEFYLTGKILTPEQGKKIAEILKG